MSKEIKSKAGLLGKINSKHSISAALTHLIIIESQSRAHEISP